MTNKLKELALKAKDCNRECGWYDFETLAITYDIGHTDAMFIAAASPDAILALIAELDRLKEQVNLHHMAALRAQQAAHANHVPDVFARDIYESLGYAKWENFNTLIKRCKQLIEHGQRVGHIEDATRVIEIGSGAIRRVIDYKLDAKAHQLVISMASAFKLLGHYPTRNETSILSFISRWCSLKKISFVPQAKYIDGHIYDALVGDLVAIEFDEPHHLGNTQSSRDEKKDRESKDAGISVLRINIESNVVDAIVDLESMLARNMVAAPKEPL